VFILIQGQVDKRNGDTMVLDSVAGHRKAFDGLTVFLASPERSIEIEASGQCHLCPEWPTLRTFRMVKWDGKLRTEELPDGVLQVSGRPDLLTRYVEHFRFEPGEDGAHRHPEQAFWGDLAPGSAMIIIQVDDYADDPERGRVLNRVENEDSALFRLGNQQPAALQGGNRRNTPWETVAGTPSWCTTQNRSG
jgi:hypothetical protein